MRELRIVIQRAGCVNAAKEEYRDALKTIYEALNHGQRKQLLKNEEVKEIFERFGIEIDEPEGE